jgi:hypothetical protein
MRKNSEEGITYSENGSEMKSLVDYTYFLTCQSLDTDDSIPRECWNYERMKLTPPLSRSLIYTIPW